MDRTAYLHPFSESDDDSDIECIDVDEFYSSLAKASRSPFAGATPRPSSSKTSASLRTPRPRIQPLSYNAISQPPPSRASKNHPTMRGFTLSYLRRVPELADMARRVVKAVAKRRMREERQKAKESAAAATSSDRAGVTSSTRSKSSASVRVQTDEKTGPRIKRLFQATIVQLLKEGSIVLWDGSTHPLPTADAPKEQMSQLWKANVTSTSADSTVFSATSSSIALEEEELVLSEPSQNEEAYVPLSPAFLAGAIERVIEKLTPSGNPRSRDTHVAATKEGILAYLRKDDRWRYLSEFDVKEALDVLDAEQRAWCVGKGVWELSF
ncbi:hypothetical protein H0H92_009599 [Tricholoma furcatifolium]|nr:hypothetical protein H0H92_009599 [Tricholoma furcatifolium]